MMTPKRGWILTSLVSLLLLGGCASAPSGTPDEAGAADEQTAIMIDHRNSSVSSATIYLVPVSGGARTVLGIVAFREQRSFPVQLVGSSQRYQLVAEGGGEPLVSREFILRQGDVIEWDLFSSAVRRRNE